ncbi:MAG: hypothetical protein JNM84_21190 [Planctomycetes bacterium]|nr:hypothetical protein [Planctomycetota bacterium]
MAILFVLVAPVLSSSERTLVPRYEPERAPLADDLLSDPSKHAPPAVISRIVIDSREALARPRGVLDREKLLEVPPDYPFDPQAPLPPTLRMGKEKGALGALEAAIRENQMGVNPLAVELSEAQLSLLLQQLAPMLEERARLIEEVVRCEGLAMDDKEPIAGRVFDAEEDAENFARELFGSPDGGSIRIWGLCSGDEGSFAFLVDPTRHAAAYHARARWCEFDAFLARRIQDFVMTR